MLSIANLKGSSALTHYYEKDDYYAKGDPEHKEASGWYGKGAARLSLSGQVEAEDFKNILDGKLPGGIELGRKQEGKLVHAPGIDLTFSAPKSVSIMAEVKEDKRIYDKHKESVLSALGYIEKHFAGTRKMEGGELKYEKVDNITAALFRHHVSREHDPQLHTHCVIANAVERFDGQWRSAEFSKIFDNKMFLGQVYRFELAYKMKELGYHLRNITPDLQFELAEVSDSLVKAFSSRSEQIAEAGADYDELTAKDKAELALKTRRYKEEISRDILKERWQEKLEQVPEGFITVKESDNINTIPVPEKTLGYLEQKWQAFCNKFDVAHSTRHIDADIANNTKEEAKSIEARAIEYGIEHISERQSVWEESQLLATAMQYSFGKTAFSNLLAEVKRLKEHGILLDAKAVLKDFTCPYTTKAVLEKELATINLMKDGQDKFASLLKKQVVSDYLQDKTLNEGQKDAISLIFNSRDRVIGIQGYAGVGKTYMLQHARSLAHHAGYEMIGMPPSSSAASTLEKDSGIKSQTIHRFLFKYDGLIHGRGTEEGRATMREELKNKILVIDEASLASINQIHALLFVAQQLNVRVVLTGDIKQLDAVELGKAFYQLQKSGMETVVMGEIVRQKDNPILKGIIYDAIDAKIESVIQKLGNNVIEPEVRGNNLKDPKEKAEADKEKIKLLPVKAAELWLSLDSNERANTLLVAPSHSIRGKMNDIIRDKLSKEGKLTGKGIVLDMLDSKDLTRAQLASAESYAEGDIVMFNRNYKSLRVEKGEYLTVQSVNKDTVILQKEEKTFLGRTRQVTIGWQPGKVGGNRRGAIEVFKTKPIELRIGDEFRWIKNSSENEAIINSQKAKVIGINKSSVMLELANGNKESFKLTDSHLKHIDYGYTSTVHAAQGKTYENVIGVMQAKHPHLTHQKLFYVTLSRAKNKAVLVTNDKEELIKTLMDKSGVRTSATEHQAFTYKQLKEATTLSLDELNKQQSDKLQQGKSKSKNKIEYKKHSIKEIYGALYSRLDTLLPEFGFKNKGDHYVSTTENRADGSGGNKKGKVYVYANNPGHLIDYTRGNMSIWDYVQKRYFPAGSKNEIMQYLCDVAGLDNNSITKKLVINSKTPIAAKQVKGGLKPEVTKADTKLLFDIMSYARKSLFSSNNDVLKYIKEKRGYYEQTIKSMELGYMKSIKDLGQHLKALGYQDEKIKQAYRLVKYIGKTHKMVLPYKDEKGNIIGLVGRNINYKDADELGKYLYTKGLSRSGTLLNMHNLGNAKEVVLVEGMLDCLHANAKGMNNVAALGGTSFNVRQLKLLEDAGVKTITLCLDNDKAGKEANLKIKELVAKSESNFVIKEVALPNGIKDADQMIKEKGIDTFKALVNETPAISNIKPEIKSDINNINLASNNNKNHVTFEVGNYNKANKVTQLEVGK